MRTRKGLTLVEMLVAMAVTLLMMGAVVTMFGNVGSSISNSRGVMEISERLRNCRNVLQRDLGSVTVTMLPPRRPESDEGYFEYIEGPMNDTVDMTPYPPPMPLPEGYGLRGDTDDVLMFTVRSRGEPYTGSVGGSAGQSLTAEVIYFCDVAPSTPTIIAKSGASFQLKTLYRRVMLIDPSRGTIGAGNVLAATRQANDLAIRFDGTNTVVCNLGDVTKRENRYAHPIATYPYEVKLPGALGTELVPLGSSRLGEDVLLTNVLEFDVKVYDSLATVKIAPNEVAMLPSDPAYTDPANIDGGKGGYVDLWYDRYATPGAPWNSYFSSAGMNSAISGVYDTWSLHYEANGTGLNGLDDNNDGVVDDPSEREAPTPYPAPLRGVQIKIRVYEPDSRQIREVTVIQDFLPQ